MGFTSFTLFRPDGSVCYSCSESLKVRQTGGYLTPPSVHHMIATRCSFNASRKRPSFIFPVVGALEAFTFNTIGLRMKPTITSPIPELEVSENRSSEGLRDARPSLPG